MKSYIHKINQYLLERYPNVWNTRLFWMLTLSAVLHLIFFLFGLVSLTNPKTLHERGIWSIFFENGAIHFSVMLTILMLVIWLINMFKNNAFKNFYPVSRWQLFTQFLFYFLIIFVSTTFYYSYNFGLKTYISISYNDIDLKEDIKKTNLAAIFFSNDIEDYTIDKRRYPSFLTEIYCETSDQLIDFEKPYYTFLDFNYQFYSLKTIDRKLNETYSYQNVESGYAFTKSNDSIITYYYKDTLVDVSNYIKTPQASYKNYSATFYKNEPIENYNYYSNYNYSGDYDYNYQKLNYSKQALLSSQTTQELLENNNPKQIKQLLNDFLAVAKKHEIEHNISTNEWFQLIYHPTDFEVKSLIRTEKKTYHYENTDYEKTESETFNINNTTDFYIRTGDLSNVFENIETIKSNPVIGETIHIFIWIAFFLASVIFVFRITGLKSLLFSIITVGLLSIFIALITTLVYFISGSYGENSIQFFISYFVFILSTFILAIPIFFASKLKKQIVAICLNISIVGFVLYVFLIIGIISIHQDHYCRNIYDYTYDCPILITSIGLYLSYVLLASGLVFLYFYTSIIKQWKALPEG